MRCDSDPVDGRRAARSNVIRGIMPPSTRFFVRIYETGGRGLHLTETVAVADETACLSAARDFARQRARAVALAIRTDPEGRQVETEIGRYGRVS